MPLFAEIDAIGWAGIIAAGIAGIGGVITSVVTLVFIYRRDTKKADIEAAQKIRDDEKEKLLAAAMAAERKADLEEKAEIRRLARVAAEKVEAVRVAAVETARLQAEATREVREVKTTLADATDRHEKNAADQKQQLNEMAKVGRRTELYCNSALGRALRIAADSAAIVAKGGDPDAIARANDAARELKEHESKQAIADSEDADELKKQSYRPE